MRTNLRNAQSVAAAIAGSEAVINAAGIPFQRGRQRYQTVHVAGARAIADAAKAAGVERLVHMSGIGADNRSSTNRYVQSKVGAEDAIVAGFPTATILRPSVVFGPDDVMFNRLAGIATRRRSCRSWAAVRPRSSRSSSGDVGCAAAAVLARPETAKNVFELGGPRVYTYREIAALVLREIDRDKPIIGVPAALMKIAGFFAESFPARARAAAHPRPGRSLTTTTSCGRAPPAWPTLGIVPTARRGHPADLSRPLPRRRPLQPARPRLK